MATTDNVMVARRAVEEAYNKGNVDVYDETLTDDYVLHDPGRDGHARGRNAAKERVLAFRQSSSDMHVTIDEVIAGDERVVLRWRLEGTNDGTFRGLPPTGRPVTLAGVTIDRFVHGRVAESWHYWDTAHLAAQLETV